MQFSGEATCMEPSEPATAERRALIDHLRAVIANLARGLAADGQLDAAYSDEIIAGTVRLIRTSHALLDDEVIAQTIH
ncbi:hypothetical protein [Rhizobium sullae]|uniref:Uncharacterized protein n=1 Tax=Rhizobium sullae TaxID=50338 RepID=A0A4R3QC04_RHISU|nr:hypothetical protein EV132_10455 [Rhizobium sullae]